VANYAGPVPAASYVVSDGKGGSDTGSLTLTMAPVADPPVAANDSATLTEDTPATGTVLGNDQDPDGDVLTVQSFSVPGVASPIAAGQPAIMPGIGTLTIAANGSWSFTPALHYSGPVPVATYTLADGTGNTAMAQLALTITPVNDAPDANPDAASTAEDTPVSGHLLSNDQDPDGNPLSVVNFSVPGLPGPILAGTPAVIPGVGVLNINPNGSFSFTPAPDYAGAVPLVTYTIADGKGGTDSATLALSISASNDAPLAGNDTATTPEDTPVSGSLLANDSDPDGNPLHVDGFRIAGVPGQFAPGVPAVIPGIGSITIEPDGSYVFSPANNYSGSVPAITYTVGDRQGGTAQAVLSLSITPVEDPGSIAGLGDSSSIVAGSDAIVREADLASGTNPSGNGETAAGSFNIADPDGIQSITVGGVSMTFAQLLAATPGAPVSISSPAYGSLAITGFDPTTGTVQYAYTLDTTVPHSAGAPVIDSIPIVLNDVLGNATLATLGIAILDDAPSAISDSDRVLSTPGNPSSVATGNVVTGLDAGDPNSSDGISDLGGADGLSATPVSGVVAGTGIPLAGNIGNAIAGLYGTLILGADGTYSYTPNYTDPAVLGLGANAQLTDLFTYQITDADGSVSTATLTIAITGTPAILNAGSASSSGVDGIVQEAGLSNGSEALGSGETVTGSFVAAVEAPDALGSITVGGTVILAADLANLTPSTPVVITTPAGEIRLTSFDPATGAVGYDYTLAAPQDHINGPVFDAIPVTVTTLLGDQGHGTLRFQIADDVPGAKPDLNSVSENGTSSATGNVLTGPTGDTPGADANL
jgi:large repetitive protein